MLQNRQPYFMVMVSKKVFSYIYDDLYCLKEMATNKEVKNQIINIGQMKNLFQ